MRIINEDLHELSKKENNRNLPYAGIHEHVHLGTIILLSFELTDLD